MVGLDADGDRRDDGEDERDGEDAGPEAPLRATGSRRGARESVGTRSAAPRGSRRLRCTCRCCRSGSRRPSSSACPVLGGGRRRGPGASASTLSVESVRVSGRVRGERASASVARTPARASSQKRKWEKKRTNIQCGSFSHANWTNAGLAFTGLRSSDTLPWKDFSVSSSRSTSTPLTGARIFVFIWTGGSLGVLGEGRAARISWRFLAARLWSASIMKITDAVRRTDDICDARIDDRAAPLRRSRAAFTRRPLDTRPLGSGPVPQRS